MLSLRVYDVIIAYHAANIETTLLARQTTLGVREHFLNPMLTFVDR